MTKFNNKSIKDFLINNALTIVVIAMIIFTAFNATNFVTFKNLTNIVSNVSMRFIIALGVSGILITKGTDLSAGRVVGITAVIAGGLVQIEGAPNDLFPQIGPQNVVVVLLVCIIVGMFFGLINGIIVAYFHVPAFIATLGTQIMIYGLNLLLTQSRPIGTFYKIADGYSTFIKIGTQGVNLGSIMIPWLFFFALLIAVLMSII